MLALDDLHERCLQLGWKSVAQDLDSILEQASKESITYAEFLSTILHHEENFKKEASWSRRVKKARFPFVKTLSEFDFTVQTSVNKKRIQDLISRSFYRDGHNILLLGPPGVGKTR